jgi:predicted nucleotidyltransferase
MSLSGSSSLDYIFKMDDRKIPESFNRNGVDYLVVGGVAVAFYGCRQIDDIHDLDFLIDPTIENSEKVHKSLSECHIKCSDPPIKLARHKQQVAIKWGPYDIDILTPSKDIQFSDPSKRAVASTVDGIDMRFIGREDLIAMKIQAKNANDTNCDKHIADLNCLQR